MKCAKVRELVSAYADGLVSPRVHDELSAHIADCESCAGEYEKTIRMLAIVSELGKNKAPVDMWPVVQVRIEDLERSRQPFMTRLLSPVLRPAMAIPVVAAAAVAVVMMTQVIDRPSATPIAKSAEMAAYYEEFSQFRSKQNFGDASGLIAAQIEKR